MRWSSGFCCNLKINPSCRKARIQPDARDCLSRLGKNSDERARVVRSVTAANHGACVPFDRCSIRSTSIASHLSLPPFDVRRQDVPMTNSEGEHAVNTPKNAPKIVSPQQWEAAREQLLVKEKALTRDRDALAAERRWIP